MRLKIASALLTFCTFVTATAPAYALEKGVGNPVPEIDGPAGVAALALLVSVCLIAYNRFRK